GGACLALQPSALRDKARAGKYSETDRGVEWRPFDFAQDKSWQRAHHSRRGDERQRVRLRDDRFNLPRRKISDWSLYISSPRHISGTDLRERRNDFRKRSRGGFYETSRSGARLGPAS